MNSFRDQKNSISRDKFFSQTSLLLFLVLGLGACSSTVINDDRQGSVALQDGDRVLILGRRDSEVYNTEKGLVSCVGSSLSSKSIAVMDEFTFYDEVYPWFEPRTAPKHLKGLSRLLSRTDIGDKVTQLGIRYIVWIDGSTEVTDRTGSISCAVGPGGGGCFGLGTWDEEARYEVSIWDVQDLEQVGGLTAETKGTSYMPAVVVPVPLLARVQSNACSGMAKQLRLFFDDPEKQ